MFKIFTALKFPDIDPVIFSFGNPYFSIRWYSIAYLLGFIFTYYIIKQLIKNFPEHKMNKEDIADLIFCGAMGIIAGGRLGEVLLYRPEYYIQNPMQIFAVWNGGMSFHGGLIGAIIGVYFFSKHYKMDFIRLTDMISVAAPIGLFFGRIANFINQELYGKPTNLPFGIIFPNASPINNINVPRHPTQIYEAILEGLLLFLILYVLGHATKYTRKKGFLSGLFLTCYALFRIPVEALKDIETISILGLNLTYGQIYCIPMLIFGFVLIYKKEIKKLINKIIHTKS